MSGVQVFSRRTLMLLVVIGLLSFAGAIYLIVTNDSAGQARTAGNSAFSDSAIGHHAFVELLRRLDIPVLISRNNSAAKAWPNHLLVVAEPRANKEWNSLAQQVETAAHALVILPKWIGQPDPDKKGWIEDASTLSVRRVASVAAQLLPEARVVRGREERPAWRGDFTSDPALPRPQLLVDPSLEPLIWSDEGVLLGRIPGAGGDLWILSDPDLLSNHGLGAGDNAVLTIEIIDTLREAESTVILDETVHGFLRVPNRLRVLFEFPLVIATLLGLIALGLLAWSAGQRFGAARPVERALQPGKEGLIANTARLLEDAGHDREVLRRYRETLLRDTAHRLHAPRKLDGDDLGKWFAGIEATRGSSLRIKTILTELQAAILAPQANRRRLLHLARDLHDWREDLINGSGSRTKTKQ